MGKSYYGAKIRTFRAPEKLDAQIENFLERSGWSQTDLFRTALQEFFSKRPPGDKVAPASAQKKSQ